MFETILVPLDGTPEGAAGLPLAANLARERDAALILLQICDDYHDNSPAQIAARDYLAAFAAGLTADGLRVTTEVGYGDIAEQIVAAAARHAASVIVLMTHGRHGLARAWYGSVTAAVIAHSPVPVLVLRADEALPPRLRTILVPLDESPWRDDALTVARGLAMATGAELVLLRAVPPLPRWAAGWESDRSWEERQRRAAELALGWVARDLHRHGVAARAQAAIGPAEETIIATAGAVEADLIVMSTHALVGPRRAFFGSVADAVVRTAPRPVLLVRQGIADPPSAGDATDDFDEARPDIIPASS